MNTSEGNFIGTDMVQKEMEVNYVLNFRTIPLHSEIDRESIFKCLYWIDKLVSMDKAKGTKEPITIQISSYGGYVYHGLSLISRIESLIDDGYEVIGVCVDVACSMGSAILNACSRRKMYRYAMVLIHQVSSGSYGTYMTMKEDLNETNRLWEVMKEQYIRRTKITKEQLEDITVRKFDWILDANKALELGVIDEII